MASARRGRLHVPRPVVEREPPLPLPAAALRELVEALDAGDVATKDALHRFKIGLSKRHALPKVPSDADLLAALPDEARERHRALLRMKATRTLSGVAVVTVQASPDWCPHGTCVFCPGGPSVGSAQSYTGEEPAALRARTHSFDPYLQTAARLAQLRATGHDTDKVDLIIQGGTFPARDLDYQEWFVQRCLDAMNDADLAWEPGMDARPGSRTLDAAKVVNETAPARCIGLTVETKPDWWMPEHVDIALGYGATRVEIGVQTLDDAVLLKTNRGHTLAHTVESTRAAKDSGFKLVYHIMPGLPGATFASDVETARRLFSDEQYRPDMLKIYPTLVMPGTPLAVWHERGEYEAITTDKAARIVAEIKRTVPPYVRIQRVDRDIPTTLIQAGVDKSNLREIARKILLDEYGETCRCVRCREVGHKRRDAGPQHALRADHFHADHLDLHDHAYAASGGEERFLSVVDPSDDALFGYLRLRRLGAPHRPELRAGDAMIREVKVPGTVVPIGADDEEKAQNRGVGRRLVEAAARVAGDDWGTRRLFVIAGVGVKAYYRRLGFVDDGVYLRKDL